MTTATVAPHNILPQKVRSVPQWQTDEDTPYRRQMIARLLQHRPKMDATRRFKLPNLAKRIELVLYRSAFSLEEYVDVSTLERRVQSLVMQLYGKINAGMAELNEKDRVTRKRSVTASTDIHPTKKIRVSGTTASSFLFNDQFELIQNVYSFLDASDIFPHFSVNRYAYATLPTLTTSMHISVKQLNQNVVAILTKCPNIINIQVASSETTTAYSSRDLFCRRVGEEVMSDFAQALSDGLVPKLQHLDLSKLYQNASAVDGISGLTKALEKGHHQQLRTLRLSTNMIGDSRAVAVAELLSSGVCPKLQVLDLSENFIGERGATALFAALKAKVCPELKEIDLRSNILTDRDGFVVADCLEAFPFKQLRALKISQNYIGPKGFGAIAKALTRYAGVKVQCRQNEIPEPATTAKALHRSHSI